MNGPLLALVITASLTASPGQDGVLAVEGKKPVAYDVVSFKPSKAGGPDDLDISSSNNVFLAKNISLKTLIAGAYGIREDLISGVTGRIGDARWDVEAKVVDADQEVLRNLNHTERAALMQPVLEERFHLKVHSETRTLPVYVLVTTKTAPKLAVAASGHGGGMSVHGGKDGKRLAAQSTSMQQFAELLEDEVHRPVIDKTNLKGAYDFGLTWSSEAQVDAGTAGSPGIFTALEEQLGLKLQNGKGPGKTLFVDHAQMPSTD